MNLNQKTLDKITEINNLLLSKNSDLKVIGFIDGEYKVCHSRVIVKCKEHGLGCYFDNPWNPSYKNLKDGNGCPKCYGNYIPTTKEAITEINNTLLSNNTPLEVIGFIDGEYKNNKSRLIVKCKEHGLGCDFDNPWNPSYNNLKFCYGCPKCSEKYTPTTEEAIKEINDIFLINHPHLEVIGFIDCKYKGGHSRVIVKCKKHGLGCDFDNPWNPSYKSLKDGNGCPKCSENYIQTTKEAITEINNTLLSNNTPLEVIGFIDGEYKNNNSKLIVKCKEHGLGCDFDNPWNPYYKSLKFGYGCPKCSEKYTPTTEEAIKEINNTLLINHPHLEVIGFIDCKYKGGHSRVIVKCKKHGLGCNLDNPWNPSYKNLKDGNGCPKCSEHYIPTTKEAITEINNTLLSNNTLLEVIGFTDGEYKNSKSRLIVKCKEHGLGCDFDNPWNPSYKSLKFGYGCHKCAVEKHDLTLLVKNPIHFNFKRNIYFITFKNLKNNEVFYKIGVSTQNGCKKRFSKSYLEKDNIEIIESKEITTNNILALLTEYYVITQFKEYKKSMFHILKNNKGGSECFFYDLTKNLTLEEMIDNAINNFDILINSLDLTVEELINAKKEFLKIKNI